MAKEKAIKSLFDLAEVNEDRQAEKIDIANKGKEIETEIAALNKMIAEYKKKWKTNSADEFGKYALTVKTKATRKAKAKAGTETTEADLTEAIKTFLTGKPEGEMMKEIKAADKVKGSDLKIRAVLKKIATGTGSLRNRKYTLKAARK